MRAHKPDPSGLIRSWITPKATKGVVSRIEGRGVSARDPIARGEVVAIKGGHIVDRLTVEHLPDSISNARFQIADDLFLSALTEAEYDGVMMLVNHSCDPNVGMGGNVALVSMRDIDIGEELTIDYALFVGEPGFAMECRCGTSNCRHAISGEDWMRAELQLRYRGWFAWWIQIKIDEASPR
jgi:uncharacterized protein